MKATEKKPVEVKIHKKPKTTHKYERVEHVIDFLRVIEKHGDKVAYSYFDSKRNVKDLTYARLVRRVKRMAAGLTSLGYAGKRIAIIGETSPAWLVTYLAVLATGGVAIPLDKELEISVIEGFLDQVDADGILYSGSFNGKFLNTMESHKSLKLFMPIAPNDAELEGKGVIPYKKVLERGKNVIAETGYNFPPVTNREGLAVMLFTSGTTGTSKCVMLSQKNVFSCVSAACASVDFCADDKIVSLLPIHHTYELACTLAAMDYGIHICINDSLTHVLKNFKIFKPNALVLVPLYVYTFYKRIWSEAKKSGRDKKLKLGLGISKAMTTVGLDKRRDLFKDVLSAFGGNLEKIKASNVLERLGLEKNKYILLSAHREENIDTEKNFLSLFTAINALAEKYDMPILYSCHPRSKNRLEKSGFQLDPRVRVNEPLGFNDYNCLQMNALAIVSDSGTLPEESSFYLSIGHPIAAVCIRTSTERPEALEAGDFILAGITTKELLNATDMAIKMKNEGVLGKPCPDYTDETVSMKVVRIIQGYVNVVNKFVWRKY